MSDQHFLFRSENMLYPLYNRSNSCASAERGWNQ